MAIKYIRRSVDQLKCAQQNAKTQFFKDILDWVMQNEGYKSRETIENRILEMEKYCRQNSIILGPLKNKYN